MKVDRPKAAEEMLCRFLELAPVSEARWKIVYDNPKVPGNEQLTTVMHVRVWNACDHYREMWLSPTWYNLSLTADDGEENYELAWARATHDRGGLELPEPGPWRYQGGNDHWGHNGLSIAHIEERLGIRRSPRTDLMNAVCGWCGQEKPGIGAAR